MLLPTTTLASANGSEVGWKSPSPGAIREDAIAPYGLELLMNRRTLLTQSAIATFGLATLFLGPPARAADPTIAGTWELNVAASKSSDPMPKSTTQTYEVVGTSEKMTGTIVTADGKTILIGFVATEATDGKDIPYQFPGDDTLVLTSLDAWTALFQTKLKGNLVTGGSRVMSKDGKVMTLTTMGVNAAGKPLMSTMVYDRR